MRTLRRAAVLLAVVPAACASYGAPDVPDQLVGAPWPDDPLDERLEEGRRLADIGEIRAALAVAEEVLADDGRHVDAHRLRQDMLRERGRVGLVLHEAEQRLAAWDDAAEAHYLLGRVALDWDDKREAFLAALERRPELFWGWLGLAFVERRDDPDRALSVYEAVHRATGGVPVAAIAYGQTLRVMQRYAEALAVYAKLREEGERAAGIASLGLAETYAAADQRREAWVPLLDALRRRPYDPGVRRLIETYVAQGLPDAQIEQIVMLLWEDPERLRDFVAAGGGGLLAALFQRTGLDPLAQEVLDETDARGTVFVRRQTRRLGLAGGDVRGFLRSLREDVPERFLVDEGNQVRGVWIALLDGPWAEADDPIADVQHAIGLTSALRDTGLLYEAQLVATLARARHPGESALPELRAGIQRELAFESGLRRILYSGYGSAEGLDLAGFLEHARELSRRVLGRDVVGEPQFFEVPLIGRLVDPFGPGLPRYLARFNKHLVLGQRSGLPPEGLLMTRLSMRFLDDSDELPLPARCWEVVGEDRQVQTLQGVLGGDMAGVALLNHYVIDMDAVRDWSDNLLARRRIVREDDGALLRDPLPTRVDDLAAVDVHWRLTCVSPVEDTELLDAVFDTICLHERAHLCDSFYFLPPENNLWRVLGLLFGHLFSSFSIEAEMEGRAEAAALAFGDHPQLVLAHIASFVGSGVEGSPHGEGFTRLARALNEGLAADPATAPFAAVSRWHAAPPEAVRRIARALVADYWP